MAWSGCTGPGSKLPTDAVAVLKTPATALVHLGTGASLATVDVARLDRTPAPAMQGDVVRTDTQGSVLLDYIHVASRCYLREGASGRVSGSTDEGDFELEQSGSTPVICQHAPGSSFRFNSTVGSFKVSDTTFGANLGRDGSLIIRLYNGKGTLTASAGSKDVVVLTAGEEGRILPTGEIVQSLLGALSPAETNSIRVVGGQQASASPPAQFSGSISVNGRSAPLGIGIQALVGTQVCGTGTVFHPAGSAGSSYTIVVPSSATQPGCGTPASQVSFVVTQASGTGTSPLRTGATGVWQPGVAKQLDLAVPAGGSVPTAPVVSALGPNTGPAAGGTRVTVSGSGFSTAPNGTSIRFGTATATNVVCSSSSSCTAISPPGTGSVDVLVAAGGPSSVPSTGGRFAYLGTGDVQVTLMWSSSVDLDLRVTDPSGETIWFDHKRSASGGQLDVDNQCDGFVPGRPENIFWPAGGAPRGTYTVVVHYYAACKDAGRQSFTVRTQVQGQVSTSPGTLSPGQSMTMTPFQVR